MPENKTKKYDHLVKMTAEAFAAKCYRYSSYTTRWLTNIPRRCVAAWGVDPTEFVDAVCEYSHEYHEALTGLESSVAAALSFDWGTVDEPPSEEECTKWALERELQAN